MSGEYTPEQRNAVRDVISEHLRAAPSTRRHPCEVTADRLGDHLTRYGDELPGVDRDAIARVRFILQEWGEGRDVTGAEREEDR